ncbi:transposase family protein [Frigoriglobus tundricola]|uniref:transposase family protein n=1 Tax=Frigoriglobus tundricola TaxID=2774151 RepID=UPI001D07A287
MLHAEVVPAHPIGVCPQCARTTRVIKQHRTRERIHDLPIGGHAVELTVRVPPLWALLYPGGGLRGRKGTRHRAFVGPHRRVDSAPRRGQRRAFLRAPGEHVGGVVLRPQRAPTTAGRTRTGGAHSAHRDRPSRRSAPVWLCPCRSPDSSSAAAHRLPERSDVHRAAARGRPSVAA